MEDKTRRKRIVIETHSITIIRTGGKSLSAFCEHCRASVTALAPEQIAIFLQVTPAEVCRRLETGELHFTGAQTSSAALVCGNSLND